MSKVLKNNEIDESGLKTEQNKYRPLTRFTQDVKDKGTNVLTGNSNKFSGKSNTCALFLCVSISKI